MGSFYRPDMPAGEDGQSRVIYTQGTPAFNAYYKWYEQQHGIGPRVGGGKTTADRGWQPPEDWTYSSETGYWYTPEEMTNAGYVQENGNWIHTNEIKKREIDKQNAELESKIATRRETQGRLRDVLSKGRSRTILTSSLGVKNKADILQEKLSEASGVLK